MIQKSVSRLVDLKPSRFRRRSSVRQVVWNAAECSQHGGSAFRIAAPDEGYGAGMTERLPIALGTLDCGCRGRTFEGFACDETVVSQIDRHRDKLNKFAHARKLQA